MTQDEHQPATPQVVLLSQNLMGVSRVAGAVRGCGLNFQGSRSLKHATGLDLSSLRALVVDLDMEVDLVELAALAPTGCRRIAYGPHVDAQKLAAAANSGWEALSNGQFHSTLPDLAREWASE